jgi:hypothetical protein
VINVFRFLWRSSEAHGVLSPNAHLKLDRLVCSLRANSIFHPHTFYPDGFGDVLRALGAARACRSAMDGVRSSEVSVRAAAAPGAVRIRLASSECGRAYAHVSEGAFQSPAASALPSVCSEARFQLVTPLISQKYLHPRASTVVVILPGTGEQGFMRRRHLVAYPLARQGITSVILEGPYYGSRRPSGMYGSKLRELSDLPVLGRGTIDEARAIVSWLLSRRAACASSAVSKLTQAAWPIEEVYESAPQSLGQDVPALDDSAHDTVVLSGTSMGGLHAAMTASMLPTAWGQHVGVAAWLCPPSGVGVFTAGALAAGVDWKALAKDTRPGSATAQKIEAALQEIDALVHSGAGAAVPHSRLPDAETIEKLAQLVPGVPRESLARAMTAAARLLRCTDITNFPPPARPDAALFVTAEHDAYVPLDEDATNLWNSIKRTWVGSTVRSINAGHVSGSLFNTDTYVDAIVDVAMRTKYKKEVNSAVRRAL